MMMEQILVVIFTVVSIWLWMHGYYVAAAGAVIVVLRINDGLGRRQIDANALPSGEPLSRVSRN